MEFQDPTIMAFQKQQITKNENDDLESRIVNSKNLDLQESIKSESSWERGLRHAKQMKEKAQQRKQMEKTDFLDKKMNLSLKEFENEKENDERYVNIEK